MDGISKKIYLELQAPTEDDNRSDQRRIQDRLKEQGIEAKVSLRVLRKLYPLCEEAEWKVTVSLAWDGQTWHGVDLEAGDTTGLHYGVAVDLGSTTVVARLVDCATGKILGETSTFNGQIPYGTDILTRIFHCQEDRGTLEILRKAAATSITTCVRELEAQQQLPENSCIAMAIGGNTTMIHFLLGMDAFCVFHTPYAVHADQPGFLPARDLELPVKGYVYIYPAKSNYLGGDITSGLLMTDLDTREDLALFLDIGTNGELVLGCREFLLMGAGAAGPALEGAVSRSGMRAEPGAICRIKIGPDNRLRYETVGGLPPKGICGSGILDLIAEGFLSGWIDSAGNLQKSASPCIRDVWDDTRQRNVPAIIYAYDGNVPLYFTQDDIGEFLTCKAAAHTMVATLLESVNVSPSEIGAFYLAGGFGTHYDLESAITVGLYPDLPREKFRILGNSSLAGARRLLLDRSCRARLARIRALATYVQFGEMEKFVENMHAARFLPHTDASLYPSVKRRV